MGSRQTGNLRMHETAAIMLCRSSFLALGFLPVCYAIFLIFGTWLPGFRGARITAWEGSIATALAVRAEIEQVETLTPSRSRVTGLKLLHPESGDLIAQFSSVTATRSGKGWAMVCPKAELSAGGLRQLWERAHDWVLCRPGEFETPVKFEIQQLAVSTAVARIELGGTQLSFEPQQETQALRLQIESVAGEYAGRQRLAQGTTQRPAEIVATRDTRQSQPATQIEIKTGGQTLPFCLAFELVPQLEKFGEQAGLCGSVRLSRSANAWGIEFLPVDVGYTALSQVDFGRLTAGSLSSMSAVGLLYVRSAEISQRGIAHFSGGIVIDSGANTIDSVFLKHFCGAMELLADEGIHTATLTEAQQFGKMWLDVAFDGTRITLSGYDRILLVDRLGNTLVATPEFATDLTKQNVVQCLRGNASEYSETEFEWIAAKQLHELENLFGRSPVLEANPNVQMRVAGSEEVKLQ